jgi:hypothetical protein
LREDPTHLGTLVNLGLLLYRTERHTAARTAFTQAVAHHPTAAIAHLNFANVLVDDGEIDAARVHYERALVLEPDHAEAHHGLAILLERAGEHERARAHWRHAYLGRKLPQSAYHGEGAPVRVLRLVSALGGNIITTRFLDDRVVQTTTLVVEGYLADMSLPPHDVLLNAVSDADRGAGALDIAARIARRSTARVINSPTAVAATDRVGNARRLGRLAGVITPRIARVPITSLLAPTRAEHLAALGFSWPLLLRAPGFHTGEHFVRVEHPSHLAAAAVQLPGDDALVMAFLDTRAPDGTFRKYRVMIVEGVLYPLHLAISHDWKVHYFTADMAERADYRALDATFLADMFTTLGERAIAALERIRETLALDYAGIDFGLDANNNVIVYEANATMIVLPPDADARWEYRRAPVERITSAVKQMIAR